MTDSSKSAVTAGFVLMVIFLICDFFASPFDWIVALVGSFLCGLLAVYLYSKRTPTTLRLRDGAGLGAATIGFVLVGGVLFYIILVAGGIVEIPEKSQSSLPFVLFAIVGGLIGVPIFRKR
jgi:hypothetical protein